MQHFQYFVVEYSDFLLSLQQNPGSPPYGAGRGGPPFLFVIRHIRVIRVRFLFLIAYGDFQSLAVGDPNKHPKVQK